MAAVFANKSFTINDWRVDPALNRLSRADEVVKIDPQNMKVLELLASRRGEVVSQSEIEESAWAGVLVTPNSVYQSIAQLRRALGDDKSHPKYIETIARKGYRCIGTVSVPESIAPIHEPSPATPNSNQLSGKTPSAPEWPQRASVGMTLVMLLLLATYHVRQASSAIDDLEFPIRLTSSTSKPVRAQVSLELGNAASYSGDPRLGAEHYDSALALARQSYAADDPFVAHVLIQKAKAVLAIDEDEHAKALAEEAIGILQKSVPINHPEFIEARLVYGKALLYTGDTARAGEQMRTALDQARRLYGERDTSTLYAYGSLAELHLAGEEWSRAEERAREVLAAFARVFRENDAHTISHYHSVLARSLYGQKRYVEAIEEARNALRILSKVGPEQDPYVAAALQILADSLSQVGEYDEAELVSRRCLSTLKLLAAEPWRVARAESTLAEALLYKGELEEAERKLLFAKRSLQKADDYSGSMALLETERRLATLERMKASIREASI
jgi:DNA-binding winged helix-turn-helix (wHTH) protein